jgi:hypothetical protein
MVQISRSIDHQQCQLTAAIPLTRASTPTNHPLETTRLAMKPARELGLLGVVALMLTSANAAPTHILAILIDDYGYAHGTHLSIIGVVVTCIAHIH